MRWFQNKHSFRDCVEAKLRATQYRRQRGKKKKENN